jgi:hypothetical protein
VNTAEPVISGTTVEGSTLSTTTGTWTGTSITFAYQWVRCDAGGGLPDGSGCPSIPGATGSSYTLTADDVGHRLRVQVTASNGAGSAAGISNASDTVTQSTSTGPPHNTVEPSLSGTPAVGRALFASVGVWSGAPTLSYAYQWLRCDADGGLPDGSNCEVISGATTSSFIPSTTDVGRRLRVRVSASNGEGTETVASNASAAVQTSSTVTPVAQAPRNTFLPSIVGSPAVAATLSASLGLWTGASPLLYTYQWLSCDATGGTSTGSGCPPIAGATATQYAPTAAMLGRRLRFQVTARNTFGTATATSNASAQVQAAGSTPPPPTGGALPPGAIRLPGGKVSIPVTSVSPPQRLVAGGITFAPNPVRSRARPIVLRVQVVDTRGYVIRDALVFVRSTPLVTSSGGEVRSGRDGWATVRFTPLTSFPLDGKSVQFFVRARKATDRLLAGVSCWRLVRVSTARTAR